jgi:hypothetical protein
MSLTSLPRTITGPFGRQRPASDVITAATREACKTFGFDMDTRLEEQIAEHIIRGLIRAYTNARIGPHDYAIVPLAHTSRATEDAA